MERSADQDFEARLEAMFADPPEAPDSEGFALALERRLSAEGRRRRLVLGVCAAGAGLGSAGLFSLTGALSGSMRAVSAAANAAQGIDLSWTGQALAVLGVAAVIWILAELSPTARD